MRDDFDAPRIERDLRARDVSFGVPLCWMEVTESTNDDAKQAARAGIPGGAAFVADQQTKGRGRLGRTWFSPPGENLYASFVVRPALDPKRAPLVTLAAGLAVIDALRECAGTVSLALKWPNDVWLDGRKVCGILCEAQLGDGAGWIVVGIGINVHGLAFPDELRGRATSLALAGRDVDRGALFAALCSSLAHRVGVLREGNEAAIVGDASALDALVGREVRIDGVAATALGIATNGGLRVRRPDGVEATCMAGEVQLSLPADSL
ncbi:MAG TPA: biotin--[acetyl-CoA-carboxylase] ligase [Polyangiaceae bacterium]|jgi:BirA family biotin operon repressor/biotin-[acetyl-CoA-carboxylase] ligase